MHAVFKKENAPFYLGEDTEITIEMDPGSFDLAYLVAVKEIGFNRISLGVQSFDDDLLATMKRVHRAADEYRSIDMIEQVFGEDANYSIDLISGVPGARLDIGRVDRDSVQSRTTASSANAHEFI